jgi:adenine phosphoribosyltransferase
VRKAGKLPYKTKSVEYALEYGTASIEMHTDAIDPGWRVLVHDDLLATGGTAAAAAQMVEEFGAEVAGFSFLINLTFLPGGDVLQNRFGVVPDYLVRF